MIGAMPAVAVRHERRKGKERKKRELYIAERCLSFTSPSPISSPNNPTCDANDQLPEYHVCGKISTLQLIVSCILLGAIVLIVGLVQMVPNAADADHCYFFLGSGGLLLFIGFFLTGVRCYCIHCKVNHIAIVESAPALKRINSIEVLEQKEDTQVKPKGRGYILLSFEDSCIDKPRYIN